MKMFVIVRKDLTKSQQAVQAGHALSEFLLHGPPTSWQNGTLIYLGVKDLYHLEKIKRKLEREDVRFISFNEPDLNDETTAIATDMPSKTIERLTLL